MKLICRMFASIIMLSLILACEDISSSTEVYEPPTMASVKLSFSNNANARSLHKISDITGVRIEVILLKSDQQTEVKVESNRIYSVDELPVTIEKLSIGYTRFIIEAFDSIDDNGNIHTIAKGASVKQLKQGANAFQIDLAWYGSDTPTVIPLPDEGDENFDYDSSAYITLSLSLQDEGYQLYLSRSDYYDPLLREVRVQEPVTLGNHFYIGDQFEIPISWRWMRSINRSQFEEIARGEGSSRSYAALETNIETIVPGIYYLYLEICSHNGVRTQYQNSPLYTVRVLSAPPAYYRSPIGISIIKKNTSLIGDADAAIATVGDTLALGKNKRVVLTFEVDYEDSGYVADPRTVMPTVTASQNIEIISTEITTEEAPVFYSMLIKMPEFGTGWVQCSAGEYTLRSNILCVDSIVKDGSWIGAGRLTEFSTDTYHIGSANARKVHIIFLYGGQAMSSYDANYIKTLRIFPEKEENAEEEIDAFAFSPTSSWGGFALHSPHELEYISNYQDTFIRFDGRGGDGTAYLGYVFAWFE